jgi:DNA-binding NarL/FixJ family response regulator
MTEPPIRVLIADDQRLVRDGIASILGLFDDLEVCASASDGSEALREARRAKPDVALLDIRMPGMDGITAAERILKEGNAAAVIMLTTFDDEEYIVKALRSGAAGYLLKDLPPEELRQAILTVHRGGFQSTTSIMGKILGRLHPPAPEERSVSPEGSETSGAVRAVTAKDTKNDTRPYIHSVSQNRTKSDTSYDKEAPGFYETLTPREKDVLSLIGQGATNYEIAVELGLSEGTVKNYVSGILDSMGFRDRIQAALFAARHGLS